MFSSSELYLIGEGNELLLYDKLGAQFREINGMQGVVFSVWAPNVQKVSVTGDFNEWNPESHPMCRQGEPGCGRFSFPMWGRGHTINSTLLTRLARWLRKPTLWDASSSRHQRTQRLFGIPLNSSGRTKYG